MVYGFRAEGLGSWFFGLRGWGSFLFTVLACSTGLPL